MVEADNTIEQFVQQLTEHQNRLYGYIYSLLGDRSRAADVLQETNLVLWRKVGEYQPERPFLPWAVTVARFQVLAHLRDSRRDRLLLDADLVDTLSAESQRQVAELDGLRDALRQCVQSLTSHNRELVEQRYFRGIALSAMAEAMARTVGSIKVALLRTRRQLAECIQKRLAAEVE